MISQMQERIDAMRKLVEDDCDPESDHEEADRLMVKALLSYGETELVAWYEQVRKWYA